MEDKHLHSDLPFSLSGKIKNGFSDYWNHLKLFSRNVRLYLTASFLIGLTFSSYMLLLNLYLREQGTVESFIGEVLSSGAIGMAVTAIPAAFIIRRIRLKPILIASTLAYGTAILILTRLPVNDYLIVFSFLAGVSFTFYRVAAAPFFMRHSTEKERTYIFSLSFGVSLLASMCGSVVFGKMVTYLSDYLGSPVEAYRWTFVVSIGLGFLAIIPFAFIKAADPRADERIKLSVELIKSRFKLYAKLFAPYFIVGSGAGLIIPFLNIYFRDRFDQPTDKIGLFYTAVHLTMLIGILVGPILARNFGKVRTMVWTQMASIPFMIALAFTHLLPVAIVAFLVRGALMNLGHPIGANFSMEMVSKSEQPIVNALLMMAWTGSWMISTRVGGLLIEKTGYTWPLMIAVGLYIVSSLLYFAFFRKAEIKTEDGYKVISIVK